MKKLGRTKVILYGLLLTAAAVGLIVDRLGKAQANSAPAGAALPLIRSAAIAAPTPVLTVEGPVVARVFQHDAAADERPRPDGHSDRDAFVMSMEMRRFYEDVSADKGAEEKERLAQEQQLRRQEAERFQGAHRLKGTSVDPDDSWALVDDRIVRVGQRVDGFALEQVERYRVQFAKDDVKIVLGLPMP